MLTARPFDSKTARILYHSTYLLDYTIEGVTLIKMAMFITGLYTVFHLSILTPYDLVLLQRTNAYTYTISKYITIWLYTTLITMVLGLYYLTFSILMYQEIHPLLSFSSLGIGLILITIYTLLLYAVSLFTKHHLALIMVMFSFFISDMLVSITPTINTVSPIGFIANIIAPNIHMLTDLSLGFIIPLRFLLYLSILYIMLIITTILTSDN
ncbi:MAG: hypothetical protein ACOC1L_00525 [Bacillota bacterium]